MKQWKKLSAFAPMLSALLLAVCIGVSLKNYTEPVYEVQAAQTSERKSIEDKKEKHEEGKKEEEGTETPQGSFELEDGTYKGEGMGYAGRITVSVEIKDKKITAVNVLEVEADDEAFFNRAKGVIDKIISAQSLDVDVVSGATYSSNGIISAVKNALTGEKDSGTPAAGSAAGSGAAGTPSVDRVEDAGTYKDGVYTGTGTGFAGPISVRVKISGGKIVSADIVSTSDGSSYIEKASSILSAIVSSQSTNVDTVSGATYSSAGLIEAVRDALGQAAVSDSSSKDQMNQSHSGGDKTEQTNTAAGKIPYDDGVYYGTGEGYLGEITVAVAIQDKTIKAIVVTEVEADDDSFVKKAKAVANSVVKKQSTKVDLVSGATYSSRGILEAIKHALKEAKKATEQGGVEPTPTPVPTAEPTPTPEITPTPEGGEDSLVYENGEYTASVICSPDENGDFEPYTLSLKITVSGDKITAVTEILGSGDAYDVSNDTYINRAANGTKTLPGVIAQILQKGNVDSIDTVSRATCSSKSIIEACAQALESGKKITEAEKES